MPEHWRPAVFGERRSALFAEPSTREKHIAVIADETRPYLQGARLTAWELMQDDIPVTLITDNMSGHIMKKGGVQAVVVGLGPHCCKR